MVPFKQTKRAGRRHKVKDAQTHRPIAGRIALIAIVIVLCLIPVFFINNAMGYVPLLSVLFAIGISYGYLHLVEHSLEFTEDSLAGSCERGESIELTVHLKNKSPLVFVRVEPCFYIGDIFGGISQNMSTSIILMPFEQRPLRFNARFDHVGVCSAGVDCIIVHDLLGLFSRTICNPKRHPIQVLPKIFELNDVSLSNVSVQESRKAFQPIVTDDMDYAGVRSYEPGDPLKTIHWKLSAQLADSSYLTRLFETFGNPGVSIVMDTTAPVYDAESLMQVFDGLVESALSLNEFARSNGIDSELCYIDETGEATIEHVLNFTASTPFIQSVPRVTAQPGIEALNLYRRCSTGIHGQGNVAFITAHVNDSIITTLLETRLHQRTPLLFVVMPSGLEGDERKNFLAPLRQLDAAGIAFRVICSAKDMGQAKEASR